MTPTDPTSYPPAIAELLTLLPLAPLRPGVPLCPARARLETAAPAFPPGADQGMVSACLAGLWLAFNFLDESHQISQGLFTPEGSYWHALMHRREPDHANAAYWFRRVGTHPVFEPLRATAAELAAGGPASASFLVRQARWDPFAFNDLCEANASEGAPAHALCRQVQRAEWDLLFAHCYCRALG